MRDEPGDYVTSWIFPYCKTPNYELACDTLNDVGLENLAPVAIISIPS
jgi:hypothetical protein